MDKSIKIFNIVSAFVQGYLGYVLSLAVGGVIVYALGWYQYSQESKNPDSFFSTVERDKKKDEIRTGGASELPEIGAGILSGTYVCSEDGEKKIWKVYEDGYIMEYIPAPSVDKLTLMKLTHVTEKSAVLATLAIYTANKPNYGPKPTWTVLSKEYKNDGDVMTLFVRPEMFSIAMDPNYIVPRPSKWSKIPETICEPSDVDTRALDSMKDQAVSKVR